MQAIVTKYFPPTNFRNARIKAICDGGSITVFVPYHFGTEDSHAYAAVSLCRKLEWNLNHQQQPERLIQASMPQSSLYSFVFTFAPVTNTDEEFISINAAKWSFEICSSHI